MPSLDLLIPFALATILFAYMPGPALLYTAAQTLARGRRAGFSAALGLHLGGYAHVIASALGLAILFEAVPVLYTVLKLMGAAYLVWLGLNIILSARQDTTVPGGPPLEGRQTTFRDSIIVEVLNPKTALFYLAFLPQFTDPAAAMPIWAQLTVLGIIVNAAFSSADVVCVLAAGWMRDTLTRSGRATRWAKRIGGTILIGLGVRVALSRQ